MRLLTIMILISIAFGQVPKPLAGIDGVWSIVNGDSTFIFNSDTGENSNYAKRMWRNFYNKTPITMGMIFEYAEECYNDSIDNICTSWTVEYDNDSNLVGYPIYDTIYFHYPPTFPGFIEWLKK